MAQRTLPLLFINLGGEMMYILDQVDDDDDDVHPWPGSSTANTSCAVHQYQSFAYHITFHMNIQKHILLWPETHSSSYWTRQGGQGANKFTKEKWSTTKCTYISAIFMWLVLKTKHYNSKSKVFRWWTILCPQCSTGASSRRYFKNISPSTAAG